MPIWIGRADARRKTPPTSTVRVRTAVAFVALSLASMAITGCADPRWSQVETCCKLAHQRNDPDEARKALEILTRIQADSPNARCSSAWIGRGHSIEKVMELVTGTISAIESHNAIEIASVELESELRDSESE